MGKLRFLLVLVFIAQFACLGTSNPAGSQPSLGGPASPESVEATSTVAVIVTPAIVGPENLDKVTVLQAYDDAIRAAGFDETSISAVAYSPDGRYVAIAGCSGVARTGARGVIYCGSKTVGEGSPYLMILDAGTEDLVANIPENEPYTTVVDLAFTHNGDRLVYAMNPGKVAVWNIERGQIEDVLWKPGHDYWHPSIAVSPDDNWIAIMGIHNSFEGAGDELKIWDSRSGKFVLETTINGSRQWGTVAGGVSVTGWHPYFSADSRKVLIPSYPDFIVYDTATWKETTRFPSKCDPPCNLAVSPDLSSLAILESSGDYKRPRSLTIWEVSTGKQVQSLVDDVESSGTLAFTPDGQMLLQDQWNVGTVAWKTPTWQFLGTDTGIHQDVREMEFADDGSSFLVWGINRVELYGFEELPPDLTQGSAATPPAGTLEIPSAKLLLEDFEDVGPNVTASYHLTGLEILSLPDQKIEPYPLQLIKGDIDLYPSPDYRYWIHDQWLDSGSTIKQTFFLVGPDFSAPVPILESNGNTDGPYWSWDSRQIAFGSTVEEGIHVYDVKSGRLKKLPIRAINPDYPSFSPSGDRIAFVGQDPIGLSLINVDGSNEVLVTEGWFHPVTGMSILWTPDGSSIFINPRNLSDVIEVYRIDVSTGKASRVSDENLSNKNIDTWDVRLSPDGKFLSYSGGPMYYVIGTDPHNPVPERVFRSNGMVWSPDSRHIAYNTYTVGSTTDTYLAILEVATGREVKVFDLPDSLTTYKYKYVIGWLP